MRLRTVLSLAVQSVRGLRRNLTVTSIVIVTACMLVLGAFILVALNVTGFGRELESQVEVRVFLAPDVQPDIRDSLIAAIREVPGVAGVEYVDRETGLLRLKRQLSEYGFLLDDLPENPLPDSFDVSLEHASDARAVAAAISRFEGVEDLRYGQMYVDKLLSVLRVIWGITGAMAGLATVGIGLIVSNTIRLTVSARRREIEIMKLVGATDAFIQFPFILEGFAIGVLGAAFASAVMYPGYFAAARWIGVTAPFVPVVRDPIKIGYVVIVLLALGAAVGLIGSSISTRRYLRV
ncbi:MAG: permease-like cell division protein FtsX [Firmicutes bacterium]|jgi:cell division transport system permease protein|nr:permease-like cell division protein FtsX [Bacillota bacterium]